MSNRQLVRLEWVILSETAQTIRDAEALEILPLPEVVARIVGRHPVRYGIDVQLHFLRGLRLANKHLTWRNEPGDQIQFGIVQVERLAVYIAVHLRVGKEDFGGATFGDDRQQSRLLELLERLSGKDHGTVVFTPRLLSLYDVVADGLVFDEQPRLVQQEHFECRQLVRIGNLSGSAVEHVKEQRL